MVETPRVILIPNVEMQVRISRSVLEGIRRESAAAVPNEACGLLFGAEGEIADWQVAENVAENPERRFEIDPRALFAALRAERAGVRKVCGYWHSHPSGDAQPSVADAEAAAPDGKLWLIVGEGEVTVWRSGASGMHRRFERVVVELTRL